MNRSIEEKHLQALYKGDQRAFEVLFLHYQPKIVYFLTGFIKDKEQARDMAQDIFLSIWNNKEKLPEINSFQAYLFKMAKNAVCNYFDHLVVNERFIAEQLNQPSKADNTEEIIFANQLQRMIDATVDKMPQQRKQIYIMSRVQGISNAEIAEKLNINKRTVENHLTAALADLRKTIFIFIVFFMGL